MRLQARSAPLAQTAKQFGVDFVVVPFGSTLGGLWHRAGPGLSPAPRVPSDYLQLSPLGVYFL